MIKVNIYKCSVCDDVSKGQIIEAALESMKQNKPSDLEVSDLPIEDIKADELAWHVYFTVKAIRKLTLSEVKSSVQWPSTGSFINEQYMTIPNLLYNLIASDLTLDQSSRSISNLSVVMSEVCCIICTGHHIYDVTRCTVKTTKRVRLAVLLQSFMCLSELVKVRQILSRVGDSFDLPNGLLRDVENFLYTVYAFPSNGDFNEVRFIFIF